MIYFGGQTAFSTQQTFSGLSVTVHSLYRFEIWLMEPECECIQNTPGFAELMLEIMDFKAA